MDQRFTAYGLIDDDNPEMTRAEPNEHELVVIAKDDLLYVTAASSLQARAVWQDVKAALVANA